MSTEERRIPPAGDPLAAGYAERRRAQERHEMEEGYREHRAREEWPDEPHPDGCFYCGSIAHPSDCCTDREETAEFWS